MRESSKALLLGLALGSTGCDLNGLVVIQPPKLATSSPPAAAKPPAAGGQVAVTGSGTTQPGVPAATVATGMPGHAVGVQPTVAAIAPGQRPQSTAPVAALDCKQLLVQYDTDQSGTLSLQEFMPYWNANRVAQPAVTAPMVTALPGGPARTAPVAMPTIAMAGSGSASTGAVVMGDANTATVITAQPTLATVSGGGGTVTMQPTAVSVQPTAVSMQPTVLATRPTAMQPTVVSTQPVGTLARPTATAMQPTALPVGATPTVIYKQPIGQSPDGGCDTPNGQPYPMPTLATAGAGGSGPLPTGAVMMATAQGDASATGAVAVDPTQPMKTGLALDPTQPQPTLATQKDPTPPNPQPAVNCTPDNGAAAAFKQFDLNQDGQLDPGELCAMLGGTGVAGTGTSGPGTIVGPVGTIGDPGATTGDPGQPTDPSGPGQTQPGQPMPTIATQGGQKPPVTAPVSAAQ